METTTKLTCKQLYECNPAFRGMVDGWVLHRWCPAEMHDLLLEEGLEDAADCARWCYEAEHRPGEYRQLRERSRAYPWKSGGTEYYWYPTHRGKWHKTDCNMVPLDNLGPCPEGELIVSDTAKGAILALLDAWRIAQ